MRATTVIRFDTTAGKKFSVREHTLHDRQKVAHYTKDLHTIRAQASDDPHGAIGKLCRLLERFMAQVEQIQDNIDKITKPLRTAPDAQKNVMANVSFASGSITLKHGLGRAVSGWRIVRIRRVKDASGNYVTIAQAPLVYEVANANAALDKDQLVLVADRQFLADVEVW